MVRSIENGNVLFLILIAVALFAALSYAVTSSTRTGGSISDDTISVSIAQIENHTAQLRSAIIRMQTVSQCDESEISFERSPFDGSDTEYVNANSPPNFSCHIFHPNGGSVPYLPVPEKVNDGTDWLFTASNYVVYVGEHGCGDTTCSELISIVPNVSREMCVAFNEKVGGPLTSGEPDEEGGGFYIAPFQGVYGSVISANGMNGLYDACLNMTTVSASGAASWISPTGSVGDVYYIISVLLAR